MNLSLFCKFYQVIFLLSSSYFRLFLSFISVKNDWSETVKQDLEALGLPNYEEIQKMKQSFFHNLVKAAVEKEALRYLLKKKTRDAETRAKLLT